MIFTLKSCYKTFPPLYLKRKSAFGAALLQVAFHCLFEEKKQQDIWPCSSSAIITQGLAM